MDTFKWVQPTLLWETQDYQQLQAYPPRIIELDNDDFLPEFLEAMDAPPPDDKNPIDKRLAYLKARLKPIQTNAIKLYQPLHSRYYLVIASLICEQIGLPDKTVDLKRGQKTWFVVRRPGKNAAGDEIEHGWVDGTGWIEVPKDGIGQKEELLSLHPVSVCTGDTDGLSSCKRTMYYGYIPVGNRQKYLALPKPQPIDESIVEAEVDKYVKEVTAGLPADDQDTNATAAKYGNDQFEKQNLGAVLKTVSSIRDEAQKKGEYVLRLVYEYNPDPECPRLVSEKSASLIFAAPLDLGAPARMIRVELPDVFENKDSWKQLRHGVAMQLSPMMRKQMQRFTDPIGIFKSEKPSDGVDWTLGMCCTFSIQIITIIAFILMIAMAIILNLIFFWLPFLRICLPIPKPSSS